VITSFRHFTFAGALVALSACSPSDGQQNPPAPVRTAPVAQGPAAEDVSPFCLVLSSSRDKVLLGEPLTLLVTLQNCSKNPQSIYDTLAPEYGELGIWIRAPGSRGEELYRPPIRRESRGARSVELAPGRSIAALAPIYLDAEGWNLGAPGQYTFRAELGSQRGPVKSKPIAVYISAPNEKKLLAAAEQMMSEKTARFLYLQGGDGATRSALESISKEFAGSPWAQYANLALAVDSSTASDTATARKPETCRTLETAASKVNDWAVALSGYRALIRCLRQVGEADRAASVAKYLTQRYPQARGIPEFRVE
jgi:hypothetical protein